MEKNDTHTHTRRIIDLFAVLTIEMTEFECLKLTPLAVHPIRTPFEKFRSEMTNSAERLAVSMFRSN